MKHAWTLQPGITESYFAEAGVFVLAVDFVAGFAVSVAGSCSEALRARFLSRFAACDRLRVFSRALSLGMVETPLFEDPSDPEIKNPGSALSSYAVVRQCVENSQFERRIGYQMEEAMRQWVPWKGL